MWFSLYVLHGSVTNWLTSPVITVWINVHKILHISLFQDIDVDINYKNYSLGVRKSLEAWSGVQIDLGLVRVFTLSCQINLCFMNLIYQLLAKSLSSSLWVLETLCEFIWSRGIRCLNFFAADGVKVFWKTISGWENCVVCFILCIRVHLMCNYFNNCVVSAWMTTGIIYSYKLR